MSKMSDAYQISRPSGICAASGQALEPGQPCVAALLENDADDLLERRDYAAEAWDAAGPPEGVFSFWRYVVPPPETRQQMLVDDEVLLDLLERLAEDDRPRRVAFRFVLCLILLRKRLLKFVGRAEADGQEGPERWLLRRRGGDPEQPPIEVVNPRLSDEDVRELTVELGQILRSEW